MTTNQEKNINALNARTIISLDVSSFAEWLAEQLNVDEIGFCESTYKKQNLSFYFYTPDCLSSSKEAESAVERLRITCTLEVGFIRAVLSYFIQNESLPLGLYEIRKEE